MRNAQLSRYADTLQAPLTRVCMAVLLVLGGMEHAMGAEGIDAAVAMPPVSPELQASEAMQATAALEMLEFNPDFLSPQAGMGQVDLSRFARGNPVLPGDYRMDLYLNGQAMGLVNVGVKPGNDPQRGRICMTQALLDQVGLDWSKLSTEQTQAFADPNGCAVLEEHIENARAALDTGELRLDITLAQVLLRRSPRGYVSPKLWDAGVNAGMLGYSFNAYRNESPGFSNNSAYLGINAGMNLGGWYFRHNGSMSWEQNGSSRYEDLNTYVSHDFPSIQK